jgi:hypothetical protein
MTIIWPTILQTLKKEGLLMPFDRYSIHCFLQRYFYILPDLAPDVNSSFAQGYIQQFEASEMRLSD